MDEAGGNANVEIRDKSEIPVLNWAVNWVRFAFFGCWRLAVGFWLGGIGFVSHIWGTACRARTGKLGLFRVIGGRQDGGGAEIGFVSCN